MAKDSQDTNDLQYDSTTNNASKPWFFLLVLALIAAVIIVVEVVIDDTEDRINSSSSSSISEQVSSTSENVLESDVKIVMKTSRGEIGMFLYPEVAPKTVENFLKLLESGFYNGTSFHRVIAGFMVQGGDPLTKDDPNNPRAGTGGPGYTFEDEINPVSLGLDATTIASYEAQGSVFRDDLESLRNVPGAISMANSGPGTNGSQFFIITDSPQRHLDGIHTVFGNVSKGLDIVRAIQQGDVLESVEVEE